MACYEYNGIKYKEEELRTLLSPKPTKTRRILEVQSDLFQKGRDRKDLVQKDVKGLLASEPEGNTRVGIENPIKYQVVKRGNKYSAQAFYEYPDAPSDLAYSIEQGDDFNSYKEFDTKEEADKYLIELKDKISEIQGVTKNSNENKFLQLLNKDNNWVTFFVKSIIQDTTKQTITEVQESDVEAKVKELEKEGLLEIDCKGKLKAEKGLQTNFTKGGRWKIYEIFEGKSHKQGGIDINIKNNQISFTNKNGSIKAKYGLVISKENKL